MLKITSVIASCARACTLEFLMRRHQSQHNALMKTVLDIMMIAGSVNSMIEWSPEFNLLRHSRPTWKKEVTMTTEKTSTPIGSSLLRPTGYWYWSCRSIIRVVVHTIAVLMKSRAASTREARTDREPKQVKSQRIPDISIEWPSITFSTSLSLINIALENQCCGTFRKGFGMLSFEIKRALRMSTSLTCKNNDSYFPSQQNRISNQIDINSDLNDSVTTFNTVVLHARYHRPWAVPIIVFLVRGEKWRLLCREFINITRRTLDLLGESSRTIQRLLASNIGQWCMGFFPNSGWNFDAIP